MSLLVVYYIQIRVPYNPFETIHSLNSKEGVMAHAIHSGTALQPEEPAVQPLTNWERWRVEMPLWGVPAAISALIGAFIGHYYDVALAGSIAGIVLWTAIIFGIGIRINSEQSFVVIERFGRFVAVKPRGFYVKWLPGLMDKTIYRGSFKAREVPLYTGEDNEIDFTDGTARVRASAWYQVGNPADIAKKRWDVVQSQVSRWVYAVDNSSERLVSIVEGNFRPLLQALSINEAQLKGETIAEQAVEESREALEQVGAYPRPEQAIVIKDIPIPGNIQALRELQLEGASLAQKAANLAVGHPNSIRAIIDGAKELGETLSWEAAQAFYERMVGLETLGKTGANISFVASDLKNVLLSMGVGAKA